MYLAPIWRILVGMNSGERWRLGHRRPGLDGLRGVAILLVIVNHVGMPFGGHAGQAGVGAFFVLSGFLITSLLLEQADRIGRVRFGAFYARRARRLAPALLVAVLTVWPFAAAVGIPVGPSPWVSLLYVMDFFQASHATFQGGLFSHTWSLAVEEQFYLLWPLVLVLLLRWRANLPIVLAVACGVCATWTTGLAVTGAPLPRILYAPDTQATGLLAGCALAAAFAGYRMPALPRWAFGVALVALPVLAFAPNYGLSDPAEVLLTVPTSVVLVWGCVDGGAVPLLAGRWLRALGERSYGVYLWHVPLVTIVTAAVPVGTSWWVRGLIAAPVTAAVVELSWRFVERPLLQRKRAVAQASAYAAAARVAI